VGKKDWIQAMVPGNVHTDLMKAGKTKMPTNRSASGENRASETKK
jgi:hypothetical protein